MSEVTQPGKLAELGGFYLGIREEAVWAPLPTPSEWRVGYHPDPKGTVSPVAQP